MNIPISDFFDIKMHKMTSKSSSNLPLKFDKDQNPIHSPSQSIAPDFYFNLKILSFLAFAPNFDVNPQSRVPRVQSLPVQTANGIYSFIPTLGEN